MAVGLLYLAVLLGIGLYCLRRGRSPEGYFLAGRNLGLVVAVLTTLASIMSGFVFVGGPGLFYRVGVGSLWIIISGSFTGALMCWVLAKPLFRLSRSEGCLTLVDVVRVRFPGRLPALLAVAALLAGVVGYLAVQLKALAVIAGAAFPISPHLAVLAALAVLVFYSSAGGNLAGVMTDVIQGVLMLWTSSCAFVFGLSAVGRLPKAASVLQSLDDWAGPWGTVGPAMALGWFLVFALGSMAQPHVVNRFMMIRDLSVLRWFPLLLGASMVVCGLIWVSAGASVRLLVEAGGLPAPAHPDDTLALFLGRIAPAWFAPLAWVGVVAAIMSTADSFAGVGAACLSRDLPLLLGRTGGSLVRRGRTATLLLFGVAGGLAAATDQLTAYLGVAAFGIFAASLGPVLVLGLSWQEPRSRAAAWSMGAGLLGGLALEWAVWSGRWAPGVPASLMALAVSWNCFILVGALDGRRSRRQVDGCVNP